MRDRPDTQDVARFAGAFVVLTAAWYAIGRAVVGSDALVRWDERIARGLVERRTPSWDAWAAVGSGLAETWTKIALTLVAVIVLRLVLHRWREPMLLAVPLVLEASVFITVSHLVARPRPAVPRLQDSPVDSSFPSGHVAAAVVYGAAVVVVAMHTRRRWPTVLVAAVTLAVAGAVGWARAYMGMHHLTDVLAGAALGLMSVIAGTWIVLGHVARRDDPGRVHETVARRPGATDDWLSA